MIAYIKITSKGVSPVQDSTLQHMKCDKGIANGIEKMATCIFYGYGFSCFLSFVNAGNVINRGLVSSTNNWTSLTFQSYL